MPNTSADRSRVSKQKHEIDTVQNVFDITEKDLKPILKSLKDLKITARVKIYKHLDELGFQRKKARKEKLKNAS